jgi:hypothetical protein
MITNLSKLFLAALIANGVLQIAAGAAPVTTSQQQTPNVEPATNTTQSATDGKSAPNPDSFGIYHAGDGVIAPKLIYSAEPEFSEKARKKKIGGDCLVSLIARTDGTTTDVHVAKSIAETVPKKAKERQPSTSTRMLLKSSSSIGLPPQPTEALLFHIG